MSAASRADGKSPGMSTTITSAVGPASASSAKREDINSSAAAGASTQFVVRIDARTVGLLADRVLDIIFVDAVEIQPAARLPWRGHGLRPAFGDADDARQSCASPRYAHGRLRCGQGRPAVAGILGADRLEHLWRAAA